MSARDRTIIGTLLVAAFVVILNETIMGVALPRLMVDLGVSARTGQWLTTAFMLTMAVVIPTTGFLLQRLTTRTVYQLAMGLVLRRHAARRGVAWILVTAAGADRPSVRNRDDDPAVDDHGAHPGADRASRRGDGQHQHRDLGSPGDRAHAVRTDPAVPVVAIHVRAGAADRAHRVDRRRPQADRHRRGRSPEARRALGSAVGAGLRRHRLRSQSDRSGVRERQSGGHRQPDRRRGLPADLRRTPAPVGPRPRQPAARPATLRLSRCSASV